MQLLKGYLLPFILLLALMLIPANAAAQPNNKRVLLVVSGYGQQQGQQAPGYEFDEFAKAYLVFKAHGIDVDIASPQGGPVEADEYDPAKPYNQQVLNDPAIMAKLANTLATAQLAAANYNGIFIVGGKGAMFDLPKDTALQQLIAAVYQQQGSIAAVCHGPAALVNVTLADGSYLVANKAVNSFTNEEEQLFGKKWLPKFEFLLQDKLIERGGIFQASPIMLNHVVADNRLITGQNPTSTVAVATALVKSLGITPLVMPPHKDDYTLTLVAALLDGKPDAAQALASNPEQLHIELVAMYGYYYFTTANSETAWQHALTLMQLGQSAINNPALDLQIAKAQHKLGDKAGAAATLQQILVNKPEFEPAKVMLNSMSL
jgi:putative intracellular protease/amidase